MFTPTVGVSYYFTFRLNFNTLNGVYHLVQSLTFKECIDNDIDLMSTCFKLVGYTEEQYLLDLDMIKEHNILKLVNPDTMDADSAIYIPFIYLDKVPDHRIKKYYKLALGLNLGVLDNVELMEATIATMKEHISAATGITDDPTIFEISHVWLTDDQYNDIEASRDQSAKKILNYFTENVRYEKEITRLRSKLVAYEEIISSLHTRGLI